MNYKKAVTGLMTQAALKHHQNALDDSHSMGAANRDNESELVNRNQAFANSEVNQINSGVDNRNQGA